MNLQGKITIVTAAGQGIGRAVAQRLIDEGAEVHASDLNAGLLDGLNAASVTAVDATTKVVTSVEGNVAGDEIRRHTYAWDTDGPSKDGKHFMGHTSRD